MQILTAAQSAELAATTFSTFSDKRPELIPTGFSPVDEVIGGLFPGSPLILGALTGVGKSGLVLSAALNNATNGVRVGYISLEDTPDILGGRLWAHYANVDGLKIRRKDLTLEEIDRLASARSRLETLDNLEIGYLISSPAEEIVDCLHEMADHGCKHITVDYLQKIRGVGGGDRRNEIGLVFGLLHRAASSKHVALTIVSQVSRQQDPRKPLSIHALKESGDLENEARVILLASRSDPVDPDRIAVRIAKSTFGGEGKYFTYTRKPSGWLELDGQSEEEDPF